MGEDDAVYVTKKDSLSMTYKVSIFLQIYKININNLIEIKGQKTWTGISGIGKRNGQ